MSDQPKEAVKPNERERTVIRAIASYSHGDRFSVSEDDEPRLYRQRLWENIQVVSRAPHPVTGEPATAKELAEYARGFSTQLAEAQAMVETYWDIIEKAQDLACKFLQEGWLTAEQRLDCQTLKDLEPNTDFKTALDAIKREAAVKALEELHDDLGKTGTSHAISFAREVIRNRQYALSLQRTKDEEKGGGKV